jgi:hypothetical protein
VNNKNRGSLNSGNIFFLLMTILVLSVIAGCSAPGQESGNGLTQKYAYIALTDGETYTIDLGEMVGGATPPYSCALVNSTLPMDFTIDGCMVTGTAKLNPGSTQFISPPILIVVTDSANKSISLNFDIRVYQEIPEIAPKIGAYCVVDQECGVLLATATKGAEPYTFKAGSFTSAPPMGTSIDNYGYLVGTPSREGSYDIDICVTDAVGATDCGVVSVSVMNEEDAAAYEEYGTTADDEYASDYVSPADKGNKTISLTLSKQGSGKVFITDYDTKVTTECVDTCKYDYVEPASEYSSKLVYIAATPSAGYWLGNITGAASRSGSSFSEEGEDEVLVSLEEPNEEMKVIFYKNSTVKITSLKCEETGELSSTNMVIYRVTATGTAFAEAPGANLVLLDRYDYLPDHETMICGEWFAPAPEHKKYEYAAMNCVRYNGESNTKWSYSDTYNYAYEADELCVAIYETDSEYYGPYSYDCVAC